MKLYIDVGGTNLRSELHSQNEIVCEDISSQESDLIDFIEEKLRGYPSISFIGISFAGQIYKGEILSAPNLRIKEPKIKEYFESKYKLTLEIDNDLNCAVRAEAHYLRTDSVLALYVGTGLGSAYMDNGQVVRGVKNQAFEVGHIPYKKTIMTCGCGKRNCLELYASASGLNKWMHYYNIPKLSLLELENSFDTQSREIAFAFKEALLFGVATLITLTNPKILVLGGGVIKHNPYLLEWLKESLQGEAFSASLSEVTLVISELQNGAISGAKLLEERKI